MEISWPQGQTNSREKVIKELVEGREFATQLKTMLHRPLELDASLLSAEDLVSKILTSFTQTLSVLTSSESGEVHQNLAVSHADSHCDDRRSEDSGESRKRPAPKDRRGCYKRRKTTQTWTIVSEATDDGHAWRKYGQKEILNAKHPRSYFRCTRKHDQGCRATKQVQRMENDPQMYQTTYIGHHTCKDTLKAPQIIMESDPNWESYIINPDSMWGKQADHALSSSSPTIKQESKEDTLSDLTDNLSSLGTNYLWSDLKAFELSDPAIMSPKLGSDNGDVVSTMYSCTDTGFDLDFVVKSGRFDSDFNFDESEFI
ncbi:putative WRKY transcription factor 70 [Fagus crenata]